MRRSSERLRRLEISQLRRPPALLTSIPARMIQKGASAAAEEEVSFRKRLAAAATQCGLRPIPRAPVSLSLVLAGGRSDRPLLEKLAKFYLDLSNGILYSDDRQVEYLEIYSSGTGDGSSEGHIHVEVDRLVRLRRRLNAATNYWDHKGDNESWDCDLDLALLQPRHAQHFSLSEHPLGSWERPFAAKLQSPLSRDLNSYPHPLAIRLPLAEGRRLRTEAKMAFLAFASRRPSFSQILVPVELDVQVWSRSPLYKDLDNILLSLLPAFRKVLLGPGGDLGAVRIYYSRCGTHQPPEMIRVRLLPMGAILDFEEQVDRALEAAVGKSGW